MAGNRSKNVLVALDNSPFSAACAEAAVSIAEALGTGVVGCHVYAAGLHERRFRQMEASLPDRYLVDDELEHQRTVHRSLISLGLRLISDSYLDDLEQRCRILEIPFSRKSLDGRNWERLAEEAGSGRYDLVVVGARGHGTNDAAEIGSVCMRVLRRSRANILILKNQTPIGKPTAQDDGKIMVAIDGSEESFGGLLRAVEIAKTYGRQIEAVAAFDPYFHYAVFSSMVEVLSPEAARVFRYEEQERLHEEIIDTGLARLYQTHLDTAVRLAEKHGVELKTRLLTGRATDELLGELRREQPWLLVVGRVGVHSGEDMDIGSVTESLVRSAVCNVLVVSDRYRPTVEDWADDSVRWTADAEKALQRVPGEYRGALRIMVHRLAAEEGHSVVTAALVGRAAAVLRPSRSGVEGMTRAAATVAVESLREVIEEMTYMCRRCGHAVPGRRPVRCPVCDSEGETFVAASARDLEAAATRQGGSSTESTFDGRDLRWTADATGRLAAIENPESRERLRMRIEKAARSSLVHIVTEELVVRHLAAGPARKSRPNADRYPANRVLQDEG